MGVEEGHSASLLPDQKNPRFEGSSLHVEREKDRLPQSELKTTRRNPPLTSDILSMIKCLLFMIRNVLLTLAPTLLPPFPRRTRLFSPKEKLHPTAYLDGLREVASLFVLGWRSLYHGLIPFSQLRLRH